MSAKHTFLAWDFKTDSAGEKLVLLQIANNSNDDGISWYSIEKMAVSCGMGVRTFQRHLNKLEEIQVIEIQRRPNKSSVYKMTWDRCKNRNCQIGTTELPKWHGGTAKMADDLNINPKTNLESTLSDSSNQTGYVQSLFEKFWKNYNCDKNSKVKKQYALKAFARLMKGKSENEALMLTHAMLVYYQDYLVGVVFGSDRMHPTTYINGRQWEDNPEFMETFKKQWELDNE